MNYIDTASCTINKRIPLCLGGELSQAAVDFVTFFIHSTALRVAAKPATLSTSISNRRIDETIEFSICNYFALCAFNSM